MENLSLIYVYLTVATLMAVIPSLIGAFSFSRRVLIKVKTIFEIPNVLIHEVSHAVAAILTFGRVHSISLYSTNEGVAVTSSSNWLSRIIVSYAGYTGASGAAVGLYYLLYKGQYEWIIYIFMGITILSTIFWVRNFYGFLWSIAFVSGMGYIVWNQMGILLLHTSIFLSSIVLIQSIWTSFVILKLSFTQRKEAGDATNLAKSTFIPAMVWGTLFAVQASVAGYYVVTQFITM